MHGMDKDFLRHSLDSDETLPDEEEPLLTSDQPIQSYKSSITIDKRVIALTLCLSIMSTSVASQTSCESESMGSNVYYILGAIMAWLSGLLYFTSR